MCNDREIYIWKNSRGSPLKCITFGVRESDWVLQLVSPEPGKAENASVVGKVRSEDKSMRCIGEISYYSICNIYLYIFVYMMDSGNWCRVARPRFKVPIILYTICLNSILLWRQIGAPPFSPSSTIPVHNLYFSFFVHIFRFKLVWVLACLQVGSRSQKSRRSFIVRLKSRWRRSVPTPLSS